ncbi:DUF2061 domain-containing protein [Agrobacterium sp. ES01]|uniref:DUF2061 domain-containing protein n=1 Tax=Agrobacterium sp. ES01 TaxID=3420714 RepID=UPI003D0BAE52
METTARTIIKALTWQLLGIATMTALTYGQTGSLITALTLALSASATGFIFYFLHEKVWNAVRWGRRLTGTGAEGTG